MHKDESVVQQLIQDSEIERVAGREPCNSLPRDGLAALLAKAPVVFFRPGDCICHPEVSTPQRRLWLIRQGRVRATRSDDLPGADGSRDLGAGDFFPAECALGNVAPRHIHTASEDTFAWVFEGEALDHLLELPAFLHWLAREGFEALHALEAATAEMAQRQQLADQALSLPVHAAGARGVAFMAASSTLGEAARLMTERRIGSVLVGSPEAAEGILTQSDLVRRGLAAGCLDSTPIGEIMTRNPLVVDASTSVLEAGSAMARRSIRHLLMRDSEGTVTGIVSERDLFRLQQQGVTDVFRQIGEADSIDTMAEVAARIRDLTERVFRQGMEVSQFGRLLSSINDHMTARLLEIVFGKAAARLPFCWLSFGSEGREEQGFVTDQDNGIIFTVPPGEGLEATRTHYLDAARRMNAALDRCGFSLCKGNIMAGNPEWCLSLDEWKRRFSSWIHATTPVAILNSTIFFDFRPLAGDTTLAEQLRDHLFSEVRGNTIFLHMLAKNALEVSPPVGRLTRFSTASGEHKGTVDLKTQGTRLFVDVARIYALATGVRATNTEQRLRLSGERSRRAAQRIEGDVAGLRVVQRLRLLRQLQSVRDGGDANRVDPYQINEVDQRTLLEAFRQAQSLQERLRLEYQR